MKFLFASFFLAFFAYFGPISDTCRFESNETGIVLLGRFRFLSPDGPAFGIMRNKPDFKIDGEVFLIPGGACLSEIREDYVLGFWEGETYVENKKYDRIYFSLHKNGTFHFYLNRLNPQKTEKNVRFGKSSYQLEIIKQENEKKR
jgi:hypothetical protein